jgi:S1 RNA binding domain protein
LENEAPEKPSEGKKDELRKGDIVEAIVKRIAPFGAFVKLADGRKGLVHISQIDDSYVTKIHQHLKVGDSVRAKVVGIGQDGKIDLSIKKAKKQLSSKKAKPRQAEKPKRSSGFRFTPFEEEFNKNLNITQKS